MPGSDGEPTSPARTIRRADRRRGAGWAILAAVEVLLAGAVVILDVFIPTLLVLAMAAVSLAVRRQPHSALGFRRSTQPGRMIAAVFGLTVAWDLLQLSLTKPILNRLTGERQDLSQFAGLQGNLDSLLVLLALSWTLAAIGEEIVYRGYVPRRASDVVGENTAGLLIGVGLSSVLFWHGTHRAGPHRGDSHFPRCAVLQFSEMAIPKPMGRCPRPWLQQHDRPDYLLLRRPNLRVVVVTPVDREGLISTSRHPRTKSGERPSSTRSRYWRDGAAAHFRAPLDLWWGPMPTSCAQVFHSRCWDSVSREALGERAVLARLWSSPVVVA